jgi:hypothetical protein
MHKKLCILSIGGSVSGMDIGSKWMGFIAGEMAEINLAKTTFAEKMIVLIKVPSTR